MIKNEIKLFSMSAGGYENISCTAPCTLASVLLDGGYIDDPLYGMNKEKVKEKLPKSCTFSADIEISGDALFRKHVYLRLVGIYASAEIFFNGRSYGMAYDPNRTYLFDITDRIAEDGNRLDIVCKEALPERYAIERDGAASDKYTEIPYIADMGIIGKCEVIFTNLGFISDIVVSQAHTEDAVELLISADVLGASPSARLIATVVSPSGKLFYGAMSGGSCRVIIKSPELWMPNGMGKPSLYKLSLTLYEGEEASDTYERMIGLRDVRLTVGDNGCPTLILGGAPIFPLGATYITRDPVISRITRASLENLIKGAASAGFNTLRVIDGGVCPPDSFYELCDKYGIMVFEDISAFFRQSLATNREAKSLSDGIIDVLAKISAHTCVVSAELSLYAEKGGNIPSSASESDEFFDVLQRFISADAVKYTHGMAFSLYREDVERYDERYSGNGYSLVALPSESGLEAFSLGEDMNILSPVMKLHGLDDEAASKMLSELVSVSKFPNGISETVYATNLTAYRLFISSVKAARAGKFENPCSGAICRQLNDPWPAVSPSFTDWYGERKAVSYAAKDAFSPVAVYAKFEDNTALVSVINESRKHFEGKLTVALYTVSDICLFESVRDVNVKPGEVILAAAEDFSKFIKGEGRSAHYERDELCLIYILSDVKGVYTKGSVTPLALRDMHFCDPKIEASVEGSGKSFLIKLTAAAYAPNVRISFEGRQLSFADNYVDISSYAPVMIRAQSDEVYTPEELMARLKIHTVYGIGRKSE